MSLAAWLADWERKPVRRVLGLMSGTSGDGVSVAAVDIEPREGGLALELLAFQTAPYEPELVERLCHPERLAAKDLCELNFLLGERFAAAARSLLASSGLSPASVDLAGSHGQTFAHQPRRGGGGATLQLGEAAVLAQRLGRPVVADFRVADVAAGGQGAPLVAAADRLLFGDPGRVIALQNIGGIANVTLLDGPRGDVLAFDNGPGNMPLDALARRITGRPGAVDEDGRLSAQGRIDRDLLVRLHELPYFRLPPPRSCGREEFGEPWVAGLVAEYDPTRLLDLLATLNRFVAESIRNSFLEHLPARARPEMVYVAGGGAHNLTLMSHLRACFVPTPVEPLPPPVGPDAREAVAFAVLAHLAVCGRPGNVPACTGARREVVLGKLVPPEAW